MVPVGLFSLLVIAVSIHIAYVAPLAIMQDLVAAKEALAHRPLPTTQIGPLIEKALDDEPRPSSLQPLWPELGARRTRSFTTSRGYCRYRRIRRS